MWSLITAPICSMSWPPQRLLRVTGDAVACVPPTVRRLATAGYVIAACAIMEGERVWGGDSPATTTVAPMTDRMTVSLLYFEGCPNWRVAEDRLRQALTCVGRDDVAVEYREVTTPTQAVAMHFRGSPSILINGHDAFADCDNPVGLSCRMYRSEDGLAGCPTIGQLVEVLLSARSNPCTSIRWQ